MDTMAKIFLGHCSSRHALGCNTRLSQGIGGSLVGHAHEHVPLLLQLPKVHRVLLMLIYIRFHRKRSPINILLLLALGVDTEAKLLRWKPGRGNVGLPVAKRPNLSHDLLDCRVLAILEPEA
jgi:hypothetical protein